MKRTLALLLTMAVLTALLAGCGGEVSNEMQIAEAYVDGFREFYTLGQEYDAQGLQMQAEYAYSWAAASLSSMRLCADWMLYLNGTGERPENTDNWDEIAAYNYASPYPWFFEGLTHHAQGEQDEALICYENALMNPAFSPEYGEALITLASMKPGELKMLRKELIELEDQIFENYSPEHSDYPRSALGYDDKYLRTLAWEALEADETDYSGALQHYEAALAVNPFDGDNFAGCALMCIYLGDINKAVYYINEGLFVDSEHKGLNRITAAINGENAE